MGIAGDGTDIVGKVFLVESPSSLQSKEVMPAFIRYGLKQFTASLGRNVFSIWMAVCFSPFLKPEHGGIVLQNEVVDNGKHLAVTVGKTHLQVGGNPKLHSDLIQQIGCSVIKPSGMDSWDWTTLWSICNRFRNRLIEPGRRNEVAVIVQFSNADAFAA